jgi:alkylhydroperoxidase family enzyme
MQSNILSPLTVGTAPAESRPTLEAIQTGFVFVPNLMATFANSPTVLNGYMAMDAAWEKGTFNPVERSLVLLTASVSNGDYCTAAPSTVLKAFMKVPADVVASVRGGKPLADDKLDALVQYTKEIVNQRGHVSQATLNAFLAAGYSEPQAMEVLIGIALKTVKLSESLQPSHFGRCVSGRSRQVVRSPFNHHKACLALNNQTTKEMDDARKYHRGGGIPKEALVIMDAETNRLAAETIPTRALQISAAAPDFVLPDTAA